MADDQTRQPGSVETHIEAGVAHVWLADEAGGNALNPESVTALARAVDQATRTEGVRVLVLGHRGDTFCRGMDLAYVAALPEGEVPSGFIGEYSRLLRTMHDAPQPVLACIDGAVRAGGVGLAAAADVVLATERTTFSLTEAVFGLVPYNVLPFLVRRVGYATARYLVLTTREVDGPEARRLGLVEETVADAAGLQKRLRAHLKQMLRCSPAALAEAKDFLQHIDGMPLDDAGMAARTALRDWFQEPEHLEPLRAFQDGDALPWFATYKPKRGT